MKCPNGHQEKMKKAVFNMVEVDYCPRCLGLWFEKDELRQAKDEKEPALDWLDLDVDLWADKKKLRLSFSEKKCPSCCPECAVPMYSVQYGDSGITVDVCNVCKGIWLDRGEFKKIIGYLKEKGRKDLAQSYLKNLIEEAAEVFIGPETFKEELADFLTVLSLLDAKFTAQHPAISQLVLSLPK